MLKEIVAKVEALGGLHMAKGLSEDDRKTLTQRLEVTRHHIHTTPHACPMAVLHDTRSIIKSLEEEVPLISCLICHAHIILRQLQHLNACTATESFLFCVKGKDEHYQDGVVFMTPKAEVFFTNILKLYPEKVSREFELYSLKNTEGEQQKLGFIYLLTWIR